MFRDPAHGCRPTERSSGGWFKGKDPAVPVAEIARLWIEQALVLYIGKAGGGSSKTVLQKRLWDYVRFGDGKPVDH